MNKLPSRSDEIYKEIESFEEYELTQCVAYEMAIRNEDSLKAIDAVIEFYNNNNGDIDCSFDSENAIFMYYLVGEICLALEMIPFVHRIKPYDYLALDYKDKRINNEFYKIIKKINNNNFVCSNESDESYEQELDKNQNAVMKSNSLSESKIVSRNIERKGYKISTLLEIDDDTCVYDENIDDYKEIATIEDFKSHLSKNVESAISSISITENFKRPKIKIQNETKALNAVLTIDISRPLNELIAHIAHIKKDLEENQDILKAPIELLGEEIQKADNLVCDEKGKCFDSRTILSKQQKLADMFYIYDALKAGATQRKIQNEVFNYYADNKIDTKTMDSKTLKKYKELATEYIDRKRYEELITGVAKTDIQKK